MTIIPAPAESESLATMHEQDARQLRVLLLKLAEGGGALADLYVHQAKDQAYAAKPGAGPSPECAAAYDIVARSVRRTVLLIQKLTAPAPAPKAVRPAPDSGDARKQVVRRVEDAIYRDAPEGEAESLHAELLERVEGPEFEDDLSRRPVAEIVDEIRADLGIRGRTAWRTGCAARRRTSPSFTPAWRGVAGVRRAAARALRRSTRPRWRRRSCTESRRSVARDRAGRRWLAIMHTLRPCFDLARFVSAARIFAADGAMFRCLLGVFQW